MDKPPLQSSTFDGYGADRAVDGVRNTDFLQGSCSHTGFGDSQPWWRVDLQSQYFVLSIQILNRGMDTQGVGRCLFSKHVSSDCHVIMAVILNQDIYFLYTIIFCLPFIQSILQMHNILIKKKSLFIALLFYRLVHIPAIELLTYGVTFIGSACHVI